MPSNSLAALQNLSQGYTPNIELEDLRKRRLLEMERNREMTAGNPHAAAGATLADVKGLESDIADDPSTGDYADYQARYQTPFETEKRDTAREDALTRLLGPERLKGQQAMDLEALRGKNALDLEQEKAGGGGSTALRNLLTPQAYDQEATAYNHSHMLPAGLTRSPQDIAGIVNRSAEMYPGADIALNAAGYKSDAASLGKLQSNNDTVAAFSRTADLNADRLKSIMQDAPGIGIPFVDKFIRGGARQLGSSTMASLDAIRQSVSREYSRILNSATLGGVVTQGEKEAMDQVLAPSASPQQVMAAIEQLKAEAQNRLASYQDQIGRVQGRLGGGQTQGAPAPNDLGADWGGR